MTSYATLTQWDAQTIADHVKADGIVLLDRFFSGEKLEQINREFKKLYASDGTPGVRTHSQSPHAHALAVNPAKLDREAFPALATVADDPVLKSAAQKFFGKPVIYPHKLFATWLRGTQQPVAKLPNVPHTDRLQMFKYMIYLHDVTEDRGAMAAAPGHHQQFAERRLDWLKSGKPYQDRPNILDDMGAGLKPIEASAGSILVFDTDMPHKAGHVHLGRERLTLRIDVVCPTYAGTSAKRGFLDRLFPKKEITD